MIFAKPADRDHGIGRRAHSGQAALNCRNQLAPADASSQQ